MEFWVQIHGLPPRANEKNSKKNKKYDGMVSELEDPKRNNTLLRIFLRVRVALDIAKPLPTGFWLERVELPKV
ncbi:hypothetical protein AHAS_Ahas05G0279700 [Arachis hypogaea]